MLYPINIFFPAKKVQPDICMSQVSLPYAFFQEFITRTLLHYEYIHSFIIIFPFLK